MIITILIFTVLLLPALYTSRRRSQRQTKKTCISPKLTAIDTLLRNVEVYDGTSRGQKRLEDNL